MPISKSREWTPKNIMNQLILILRRATVTKKKFMDDWLEIQSLLPILLPTESRTASIRRINSPFNSCLVRHTRWPNTVHVQLFKCNTFMLTLPAKSFCWHEIRKSKVWNNKYPFWINKCLTRFQVCKRICHESTVNSQII